MGSMTGEAPTWERVTKLKITESVFLFIVGIVEKSIKNQDVKINPKLLIFGKPNDSNSACKLLGEGLSSKKTETRAGGMIRRNKKPIPAFQSAGDGSSVSVR